MKIRHKEFLSKFTGFENKTAVITGASGVIGRGIAVNFLMLGMNVILPVLTSEEGVSLKAELAKSFDESKISIYLLNLMHSDSIAGFVNQIKDKKINYLINNAGVIGVKNYQVNFKGTLELTLALTPVLNKVSGSRVVFQSSMSYRRAKINWDNMEMQKRKGIKTYARTKRLLNLAVLYLKQNYLNKYPNVSYAIAHPGCVASTIAGDFGAPLTAIGKLFFHSPQTAALSATIAAITFVPDDKLVGPKTFEIWGKPKLIKLDKALLNEDEQVKIKELLLNEKMPI